MSSQGGKSELREFTAEIVAKELARESSGKPSNRKIPEFSGIFPTLVKPLVLFQEQHGETRDEKVVHVFSSLQISDGAGEPAGQTRSFKAQI